MQGLGQLLMRYSGCSYSIPVCCAELLANACVFVCTAVIAADLVSLRADGLTKLFSIPAHYLITGFAISPDESHIVVGAGLLEMWDLQSQAVSRRYTPPTTPRSFNNVRFDHQGRFFTAWDGTDAEIKLFDSGAYASGSHISV